MLPSLVPVLGCPAARAFLLSAGAVLGCNNIVSRILCGCNHSSLRDIHVTVLIITSSSSSSVSRQSSVVSHHSSCTIIIRSSIALHYRPSYHPSYVIVSHPQSSSVIIHRHHQSSIHQSSIRYLSVIHHLVIHQSFIIIFTIIFVIIIIFSHNSYHLVSTFVMHVTPACSHRQQRAASVPSRRPANLSF